MDLGDASSKLVTGVWWDLNTCPVPDGVDPLCIRRCIDTALQKRIGQPSAVVIYAIGNLEFVPSDTLELIANSGINPIHATCGGLEFVGFVDEWARSIKSGYTLVITDDYRIAYPHNFQLFPQFTHFLAYPKHGRLLDIANRNDPNVLLANEFVWDTLVFDHCDNICQVTYKIRPYPLYICNVCNTTYEIPDAEDFITHLNSDQHRKEVYAPHLFFSIITKLSYIHVCVQSFDLAPKDSSNGEPIHFCPLCNYPAYDNHNLLLHNKSEQHTRKVTKPHASLPLTM